MVRNAADLLGEMQVAEAEEPLSVLLKHEDERGRRAGTGALMSLGTPRALKAIQQALTDPVVTRMQAAAALVARRDVLTTAPQLLRALNVEEDEAVQAAFLAARGYRAVKSVSGVMARQNSAMSVAALSTSMSDTISLGECM